MFSNNHFDVAIIGTGAGGGTLAYALAPSGKRILVLERGSWLPREKENWDPREVFKRGRVGGWRGSRTLQGVSFPGAPVPKASCPVSSLPSSNRACSSPAPGFPRPFIAPLSALPCAT